MFLRLVAAARAALDKQGLDVNTREIAQRAGVGLGTLYRRVPSLEELLRAILVDTIDELTERATLALDDPDLGRGFARFAETFVRLRARSCGLHAAQSRNDPQVAPPLVGSRDEADRVLGGTGSAW